MAERGRRGTTVKTPPALKLIEGRSPGRDSGGREVQPPPAFARQAPVMPEFLYGDARDEWERVLPELELLGLVKEADAPALAAYCLSWQRVCQAQRVIDEEGLFADTSQGRGRHPAVAVLEAASKELRAWAREFGFTPSAEAGLHAPKLPSDADSNPFASSG